MKVRWSFTWKWGEASHESEVKPHMKVMWSFTWKLGEASHESEVKLHMKVRWSFTGQWGEASQRSKKLLREVRWPRLKHLNSNSAYHFEVVREKRKNTLLFWLGLKLTTLNWKKWKPLRYKFHRETGLRGIVLGTWSPFCCILCCLRFNCKRNRFIFSFSDLID